MIANANKHMRCAIYCRKSTTEGLEQGFNSLDAQRAACESFIASQSGEGWVCVPDHFDDGGYSGGNVERPALKRLLHEVESGSIDCVVVYKIDRLSRSLLDFARLMQILERHRVALVSVTQSFDTSSSMGRLTLNMLLSFAQFEREIISERTRDKIAATRRRGKWTGGRPILGYDVDRSSPGNFRLVINEDEAVRVRQVYQLYLDQGGLTPVVGILNERGWTTKRWATKAGREMGGKPFDKCSLHALLTNVLYRGQLRYKTEVHPGEHDAIISESLWRRVQAQLQRNGRSGAPESRNKHGALLRGILRCGPCGCAMGHTYTSRGPRRYRYYTCLSAQKRGWSTCPSKSVPAGEIERFVVEQLRCIGKDPVLAAETVAQAQRQAEDVLAGLAAEEAVLERDLRRDHAALRETSDAGRLADMHERIAGGERRMKAIAEEVAILRDSIVGEEEIVAALAQFDVLWEAMSPKEQARVLDLLVEQVVYDGEAGTVAVTFRPSGIRALEEVGR